MARTKQTTRKDAPLLVEQRLQALLPTGPQVPPAKTQPVKNATKKTSATKSPATKSPATKAKTPQKKKSQPQAEQINWIDHLLQLMEKMNSCKDDDEIRTLLKEEKLDFIDFESLRNIVTYHEDRFVHQGVQCPHAIFDVYGDGNCLFYSLLLLLRVHD